MISNGMLKLLLILTASALRPSILVIDEIENSIHPKAVEFIIDELRDSYNNYSYYVFTNSS